MGYVDSCRNISLKKEGNHLWLSAECRKKNGEYRTSQIDLNLCIGPESGGGPGLEALNGWKVVTLTGGGGKGNYNEYRNWELRDDNRKFWAEGELRPGLKGVLPWNWFADSEWGWKEFPLDEHLNNMDGTLKFWAKKYESMFSSEVMQALEIINKVAEGIEKSKKSPLEQAVDEYCELMMDEKLRELGWEEKEREWLKGVGAEGDWIVRYGS